MSDFNIPFLKSAEINKLFDTSIRVIRLMKEISHKSLEYTKTHSPTGSPEHITKRMELGQGINK